MGKKNRLNRIKKQAKSSPIKDETMYQYVPATNELQQSYRLSLKEIRKGKKCCLICGDTEEQEQLVKVKLSNGERQTLCVFCRDIQLNM